MPAPHLRNYRPADFARLCAIDRRCFEPGIAYTREEMTELLGWPTAVTIVAEGPDGRVVGFVLAHPRAEGARLITLDVLPSRRRRGLGRRLLAACERRLRTAGVSLVLLETAVSNAPAQALYSQAGYTRVRRLPRYYADGEDAWQMRKSLV